jgi:hypothetical protein
MPTPTTMTMIDPNMARVAGRAMSRAASAMPIGAKAAITAARQVTIVKPSHPG